MDLIYVSSARLPTERAYGHAIMRMCESLARAHVAVTLLIPGRKHGSQEDPFTYYGIAPLFSIRKLSSSDFLGKRLTTSRWRYGADALSFLLRLALVRFTPGAVLYTRDYLCALLMPKKNLFLELHVTHPRSMLFKLALRRARGIIVISKGLKDSLVSLGVRPERILISPSGVDLATFDIKETKEEARAALDLTREGFLAVYTGNFTTMGEDKGLSDIIAALPEAPDVRFIAVGGSDNDPGLYASRAQSAGVGERVHCLGYAPQTKLALYQKAADALLMPFPDTRHYRFNMSPVKMFEYMASGRPIIASDLPTIREVLNEERAVIVPPGAPHEIAQALNALKENPARGDALAAAARREVDRYTWDARAKRVIEYLQA
jgi:glycosyltransferase involved in cell wall biosynthesis